MDVASSCSHYYNDSNKLLSHNTFNQKQIANQNIFFYKQSEQQNFANNKQNDASIKENLMLIDNLSTSKLITADALEFEQILRGKNELPQKLFNSKNEAYPHGINKLRNKINSCDLLELKNEINTTLPNEIG